MGVEVVVEGAKKRSSSLKWKARVRVASRRVASLRPSSRTQSLRQAPDFTTSHLAFQLRDILKMPGNEAVEVRLGWMASRTLCRVF